MGKGDGNAVYGAGTYLSTDEVIHRGDKKVFSNPAPGMRVDGIAQGQGTSASPSPTYHVSVQIMPSQIMDWGAALSAQSGYVKKRLEQAGFNNPDATGAQMYHALSARLGSQAAASEHLQGLGILGHSYGATPKRSPNYVIYDDSRIETNYVHFNKQGTSGDAGGAGSPDVLARLVSRRADARVASFPTLDGRGHSHGVSISFGPDRNEPFTHHFYNGTDGRF